MSLQIRENVHSRDFNDLVAEGLSNSVSDLFREIFIQVPDVAKPLVLTKMIASLAFSISINFDITSFEAFVFDEINTGLDFNDGALKVFDLLGDLLSFKLRGLLLVSFDFDSDCSDFFLILNVLGVG